MNVLRIAIAGVVSIYALSAHAMNNPASAFCEKMGGRLEIVRTPSGGEIGLCHMKDGRIIEEWTLFRMYEGRVPAGQDPSQQKK